MRPLFPSLESIARQLFRPSDQILARIAARDPAVPTEVVRAVEADTEASQVISDMRSVLIGNSATWPADLSTVPAEAPAHLADLFRRRVATNARRFSKTPSPGQILSVEHVAGPKGDLGWDLARPLAVLIDGPSLDEGGGHASEIWYGWMVAPETDYATFWDFVLQEEDEPFDPLAGMVQIWNPVNVYLKSTTRVLGELAPARLQAVRALADEYLTAAEPDVEDARPGLVAARTTMGGLPIVTGTPLSGSNDPRWRYQEIYHAAAEALREPVRLAREAAEPNSFPDVIAWLKGLFAGYELVPVPAGATLGSDETESAEVFQIGDLLEVRGSLYGDGARLLKVRLLAEIGLTVVVREAEGGIESYPLHPDQREAIFELAADRLYHLDLLDVEGQPLRIKPQR